MFEYFKKTWFLPLFSVSYRLFYLELLWLVQFIALRDILIVVLQLSDTVHISSYI